MTTRATLAAVLVVLATVGATAPVAAGTATGTGTPAKAIEVRSTEGSAAGQPDCSFPAKVTDVTGTEVTIEEEPQEVVTLAPSAAQTMWEIDAREKVVGVSQFATYLEGAGERTNISAPGFGQYKVERMVAMDPDLVLAPNVVPKQAVKRMRSAGLTVVKLPESKSIQDVKDKTKLIGRLVGNCQGATDAVEWIEANVEMITDRIEGRERPKVLYMTGTYTTGTNTFVHDVLSTAGGFNIMAQAGVSGFVQPNPETVADQDPEWLVVTNPNAPILDKVPYNSTTAVKEGNVLAIDPNYLNQPAPRSVVFALRNMTEAFHSDVYGPDFYVPRRNVEGTRTPGPTPTATTTDAGDGATETATPPPATVTETETATATGTETTDSSGGGLPGFGAGVAAVALALAVFLLRRRR